RGRRDRVAAGGLRRGRRCTGWRARRPAVRRAQALERDERKDGHVRLVNEFEVGVPVERTWDTLLDVPRVARALPGATIDPDGEAGAWRGTMKIKLGPVTTEYAGTARVQDIDADDRVASYRVEGREARGQGSAAATIT